jgi:hypothetical protein
MTESLNVEQNGLRAFFDSYTEAWRANSLERIAQHWSPEHFVFYKAEEIANYFVKWDELLAYWRHNEQFHEQVELTFGRFDARPAAPGLVAAPVPMRWDILFSKDAKTPDGHPFTYRGIPLGGDNHVLCLLRQLEGGWKLCGWSETPDSPILYVAELYKKDVRPGIFPSR